jgi:penicillin-binding protein 1A
MTKHLRKILTITIWCIIDIAIVAIVGLAILVIHIENELPDVSVLNDVQMQVPLRIYTNDGKLIAEYGEKRRVPVPYEQIPKQLVNAVLATEDQRFFEHPGVDFLGLMRASVQLALTGTKSQGGSTITMQVARNFFLSPQKTYTRKLKEILLAMKIEHELDKEKILDLYLNKIYFGNRAYGVAAAAQVYFGKNLNELTLPEIATIAGLPKAPTGLNPLLHPTASLERRNHVLSRMLEHHYIDQKTYENAIKAPLTASYHELSVSNDAPYVAEMVRNAMVSQFGEENAYTSGYKVYTTIDTRLQSIANVALDNALFAYEQRHGYRGPVKNLGKSSLNDPDALTQILRKMPSPSPLKPAVVIALHEQSATMLLGNTQEITLTWEGLSWARRQMAHGQYLGRSPTRADDILKLGDVVYIRPMANAVDTWQLTQIPEVQGALIAMRPKDGAILALDGGFDYYLSSFNRVTQAQRQPGSSFKPFIYAAGLAKGLTLATVINDAPIAIDSPDGSLWRPQNSTKKFYGPTRLRVALTKSRNLVSIRLLQLIGIHYTTEYLENFGFSAKSLPHSPSLALGTASLTPLELATGYTVFASGGYQIKPYFIDHILDAKGQPLYQASPQQACESCLAHEDNTSWTTDTNAWSNPDEAEPEIEMPDLSHQEKSTQAPDNIAHLAISPQVAYLITSALQDVIKDGTGRAALSLNRSDIAGKTGTTNEQKDGWFAGYNSDIVTITWIGYDQPRSLFEYGAEAALPMWIDFMSKALAGKPSHTMPQPKGIVTVRIDPKTGYPIRSGDDNGFLEVFDENHIPSEAPLNTDWNNPDAEHHDANEETTENGEGIFHLF